MKSQYPAAAQAIQTWLSHHNPRPGTSLPSTKALAAQLGFNQAAIVRACNVLISGRFLYRQGYKMMVGPGGVSEPVPLGIIEVVSYLEDFTRAAGRILTERGIGHRLTDLSWTQHSSTEPVLRAGFARKPAGVILWTSRLDKCKKPFLEKAATPMVICADGESVSHRSTVQTDFHRGTEKALTHLYELGHRHIAHVTFDEDPMDREIAACFRTVCLKLNVKSPSSLIWKSELREEGILLETILVGLRRRPEVTAIFCEDQGGVWITRHFMVPRQLSVVVFSAGRLDHSPPLTTVALPNVDGVALWACTEMISQVQTLQSGRPPKPPTRALFVPDLVLRGSTRALVTRKPVPEVPGKTSPPGIVPGDTAQNVYRSLRKNQARQWLHLDLSPLANHRMTRHRGWLGAEPLKHFSPGLRSIHGVPFQVLDAERNHGRDVVTFRSPHSHSAEGKELPGKVKMKVNSFVQALYFLHGCGYAQPVAFASYVMRYLGGSSIALPLIPLGPSRRIARKRLGALQPNLQDWWPDFEQGDLSHAHHFLVFDPADPASYQRSLYSLEWINPQPQNLVSTIEVRVDPAAGPALALIAVTALL